jgi:hypothetical protein
MKFTSPSKTKNEIANIALSAVNSRLSAIETKLKDSESILDGVALEELVNFSVPLTGEQRQDQLEDGILLSYKDGMLVEETKLNGGEF